ncbi:MAG: response regulator [Thermomicrobiales bacterium]
MEPLRILIADDHPLFRDGLRALLEATPDMELVGEAATGDEAVTLAAALQPDVLLMDLKMPGVNGVAATRATLHASPHIGVLVVTMFEDDNSVFAAMRAGARGYLLKGTKYEEIPRAVRSVGNGEAICSPTIATRLIAYFAGIPPVTSPQLFPTLTTREREVLGLIAQGDRNAAIADRLYLSEKTVRNHVTNILSKLQVADRAHAIIRARDAGLRERDG